MAIIMVVIAIINNDRYGIKMVYSVYKKDSRLSKVGNLSEDIWRGVILLTTPHDECVWS